MRNERNGFTGRRMVSVCTAIAMCFGASMMTVEAQEKPKTPTRRPAVKRPNPAPVTPPGQPEGEGNKPVVQPQPQNPEQVPPATNPSGQPAQQPAPQPAPGANIGQPVGVDETGRVKIDPELQKKIDQMLMEESGRQPGTVDPGAVGTASTNDPTKTAAQRAAERRRQNNPSGGAPAVQPNVAQPNNPPPEMIQPTDLGAMPTEEKGPSTEIEIPPEPDVVSEPPEQRTYSFSIKNGTYEQLIRGFARQTGLGVLGEAPREGTVTFETTESLSFRDALGRVRMLLFNYKPHEPYWILYEKSHLLVIRVTDLYRILPKSHMYQSVEEFELKNPAEDEIVLVIYTPKTGSIADLRQVRDFLPDYVRVTPLETGNSVSIFALVKDINKYLELIAFFPTGGEDPRAIERFDVQFISATEAVNRLRLMADLDGAGRAAVPQRRVQTAAPSMLEGIPPPTVSLIPDDTQGYFLVRAMKDKIEEIRRLLPYVDVDTSTGDLKPVVIPIEHATAADLVTAIQQVLSASSTSGVPGMPAQPVRTAGRRGRRASAAAGASGPVSAESVTMIPHPSRNAIVVLGDEHGVAKVRDLVALFDVVSQIGPLRIQLEVADANEVSTTVGQILGGGGIPKGQPGGDSFQLIPDPSGGALWYSGTESELTKVKEIIALLDVAQDPVALRVVRLIYQTPSFVTGLLRELDGSTAASPAPAAAGRTPKSRRVTTQAASKFTPDDVQKLLYILCTESDWKRYEAFIAQIDVAAPESEPFVRLTVTHLDPATAVERLGTMLSGLANVDSAIRTVATDDSILVVGATPTDIARIKVFLEEVDKPSLVEQRTFEIKHSDPSDIKATIEALLGDGGGVVEPRTGVGRRRIPRGDAGAPAGVGGGPTVESVVSDKMTIVQIANRLIVKATPRMLDEVAKVIAEFDIPSGGTELKVFSDFPPGSDIVGITETLTSVFAGPGRAGRRAGRDGAAAAIGLGAEGPRFIPQPASSRLVVIGDPAQFPEIEKLLNVLRVEASAEPSIVEFIDVKHGDPLDLVEDIRPLLDLKIRGLVQAGELADVPTESTAPSPVPNPRRIRALQQGGNAGGGDRYHIAADARNERIVIAAPKAIIAEARRLVEMFDQPAHQKDKVVFRTVELANASPSEMIKTVKEMMGRPTQVRAVARPRPVGVPGSPGAVAAESLSTEALTIVEAPGGGSIILNGIEAEVDKATEWIHKLDELSTRGRRIKLYQVKDADTAQLFDLIVNVVDSATPAKTGGVPRPARMAASGKGAAEEEDEEEFTTTKTHSGGDLYIQADLIGRTMLVATTASKLAQIDDIFKMFEEDEVIRGGIEEKPVPKFIYKLEHADASDARWDLEDLLESLWEPHGKLPKVEKLFKDSLVIRYPDESRFEEIKAMIAEHVDKPSDKPVKVLRKSIASPAGMSAEATARWLKRNLGEYEIDLVNNTPEDIEKKLPLERVRVPVVEESKVSPCVMPLAFDRMAAALLGSAIGQQEPPPEESAPPEEQEEHIEPIQDDVPVEETPYVEPPVNADLMIQRALQPIAAPKEDSGKEEKKDSETERDKKGKTKTSKKLKVIYDDTQGVIVVEGEEDDLDTVKEAMEDLDDEIKDLLVAPDIRIYRVKYIDVFSAQDVLEEMFNATKSQQAQVMIQQQQAAQMARMQQMQQQRQQQQQQQERGGQDQDGKDGAGKGNQPQQPQQPQIQVPQLPAPAVRVYPNPRDRTLILRAETSQYPQILELLATIDQPKPVDSIMRTYQLKKLNAAEVEQMLREMLRLDAAKDRPRAAARGPAFPGMPGAAQASTTGPGGQLPQTVLQESTTGSLLGVDPQDITLFSSETANTIMAMAPPAALDYIGKLIDQFESGDIAERLTRYYELKHAEAAEVAEQLSDYFAEKSPGRSGKGSKKSGGEGAPSIGGGGMNAPSFIAYDRLNMLTVQATAEQIKEIEEVLTRFDVKSTEDEWKDVVLAHADAKMVADTLGEMFGGGSGASAARGAAGGPVGGKSGGGKSPKFIGEAGGRIVLFSAPTGLHEQILSTVAKLEEQSKQTTTPRIIELTNATPSQVADAIEKAYDSKRTARPGSSGASALPRFTVTAHDASRRLFVVADDEMFSQVESLAKTLDTPGSGISVEFRIYPLQYANAKAVHGQLTKLMTEYVQRLGPQDAKKIEAFSVQPDETANALIVLGTPSVFGFIEENLRKIDTPASAVTQQEVHVVEVKNADPDALVKALTDIFVRNAQKSAEGEAAISISAATGSKAILVRCNAVDFAKIDATIKELDTQEIATAGDVRVVTLQYGDASEINTALQAYLKKPAGPGGRGDQLIGDVRLGVLAQTNAIMISGDQQQLDRIESIAKGMDIAGEKGSVPQIITLKYASSSLLLPQLKEMFNDPKMGGGKKHYSPPVIVADETSNAIIVRASATDLAAIQGVVEKIDTEDKKDKSTFRIVQVSAGINVDDLSEKVEQSINESAKMRAPAGSGRGGSIPTISALADRRTNSITIAGSPMLFNDAEQMIRTLEKMGPTGNNTTIIVPVPNIATEDIQRLIDQMTQQSNSGSSRRGSSGGGSRPTRGGGRP